MDARKERYGADDLDDLFDGASKVIAARGKKHVVFDMKKDDVDAAEFEKNVLGPSGNLRAPTLRLGKTWIVGFGEPAWLDYFG